MIKVEPEESDTHLTLTFILSMNYKLTNNCKYCKYEVTGEAHGSAVQIEHSIKLVVFLLLQVAVQVRVTKDRKEMSYRAELKEGLLYLL